MRIGVDVGGTNTDAVLMDGNRVRASFKSPTSSDIEEGIISAVQEILKQSGVARDRVHAVMIGTTQFTNAFVERRRLTPVGVIRLGLPASSSLQPMVDWPSDLKSRIGSECVLLHGGYHYDGREISALREDDVRKVAKRFREAGLRSIALSCVFAPISDAMERRSADIVREEIPGAEVSLSSELGRISLIERENATIMNASLAELANRVVNAFNNALLNLRLEVPFFISQNDGTLMQPEYVRRYPVLTFASGPTNSMRGAVFLSGLTDAIVVDIGGTTTDIGAVVKGFPRESSLAVDIGGVQTNFRMPDILSIGLGGGSLVRTNEGLITVGPDSVGYRLAQSATVFGGGKLTATDVAVRAGYARIGDPDALRDLDMSLVQAATERMQLMVAEGVDRVKTAAEATPVVLVGGGAFLIKTPLAGASDVIVPEFADVANAIGATLAQAGGEIDRVFSYDISGREAAMTQAKQEAIEAAVSAGAETESVEIIDVDELPLAYLPGGAVRLRVKAVGNLAIGQS